MGADGFFHGLAQVLPEVETVSDLHGLRCALAGAFAITAGAVPADHGHFRVAAQPRGQIRGFAALEQLDRAVRGHVDQHRAVVTALAEREVINAQHGHRPGHRFGQRPDQPQQRVPAHGHACGGGQADPGAARQRQRDLRQQVTQ